MQIVLHPQRADRARELTTALTQEDFAGFARPRVPKVGYVCMTEYERSLNLPLAFGPDDVRDTLVELQERFDADELIVLTVAGSYPARLRSYQLLAEAFKPGRADTGQASE